jgi:hypothetical protein
MHQTATLFFALCFCVVVGGCANTVATGAAQAESRSVACAAACQQVTPASATTAAPPCDECVCDRVAGGPAVCTARPVRN